MIVMGEGGTAKVSVRYSIRKGEANYSSQEVSMSLDLDVVTDATVPSDAQRELGELHDYLLEQTKAGVIAALNMDSLNDENGAIQPMFGAPPAPAQPAPVAQSAYPTSPPPTQPAPQQGGQQFAPPKATKAQLDMLPRYQVDFGAGIQVYVDQRPLKAPLGPYSAKAPDFKNAADKDDAYWILGPKGNPNSQVQAAMQAAGIPATVSALPAQNYGPDEAPF